MSKIPVSNVDAQNPVHVTTIHNEWYCPENCKGMPNYGYQCPDDLGVGELCPLGIFENPEDKITDLVAQAQKHKVNIYLQSDQIKLDFPWPIESTPDDIKHLFGKLKRRKNELQAYLLYQELAAEGKPVKLAHRKCYERGHCCWVELDCPLFPVSLHQTWLCRDRVKA